MLLVFYISHHGFGHATRQFEVISHIRQQRPDARIVVRTAVPSWFVERSARGSIELQPCETDTGMEQIDGLRLDEGESARRAAAFYRTFPARVESEARVLDELAASVVVGDVPPLAFAAAARAGVPSVAVANFTWDWIYAGYPAFAVSAPHVTKLIGDAYSKASLALRLPFHAGFDTMRGITRDVPLVARLSRRGRDETRGLLDLDASRPIVLVSFGGHGTELPLDRIASQTDATLLVTDYEVSHMTVTDSRLRCVSAGDLAKRQIRYEDLVASADVVVSKPGYGIVSECIANGAALLYTSRGYFPENAVLVEAMPRVLRCRFIARDDLLEGRWQPFIEALVQQPAPPDRMDIDGASVVASAILEHAAGAGHYVPPA